MKYGDMTRAGGGGYEMWGVEEEKEVRWRGGEGGEVSVEGV